MYVFKIHPCILIFIRLVVLDPRMPTSHAYLLNLNPSMFSEFRDVVFEDVVFDNHLGCGV